MPVPTAAHLAPGWIEGATVRIGLSKMSNNPALPSEGTGGSMEPEITVNDEFYDGMLTAVAAFPDAGFSRGKLVRQLAAGQGFSPTAIFPGPTLGAELDIPEAVEVAGIEACRWDVDLAVSDPVGDNFSSSGASLVLAAGADTLAAGRFFNPSNATSPPGYAIVGGGVATDTWLFQARSVFGTGAIEDFAIVTPPFPAFFRVSFRILRAVNPNTAFFPIRNQQFRCLVNGVQVFAEDLGDANAPQPTAGNYAWRFCVAAGTNNDDIFADNAVGWWGDSRVYFGP